MAILTFIRANEESTIKSQRVAAAWEIKRKLARKAPITACCPGWIRLSEDRSKFVLIPDRAKIIRRIFKMAVHGDSSYGIAKRLNLEKIPPLRARGRSNKYWTVSSILMILRSETVYGTLTPSLCRFVDGARIRTKLESVENYYPAVVTKDIFEKAQQEMAKRTLSFKGTSKQAIQNIVGYITRCGYCDSAMVKSRGGNTSRYLICRSAILYAGCIYGPIRYSEIERSILEHIRKMISIKNLLKDHSFRIWASQIQKTMLNEKTDRSEFNRLIRKSCASIRIFHDLGVIEIHWKDKRVSKLKGAFSPSTARLSTRKAKANIRRDVQYDAEHHIDQNEVNAY